jgi:hypothetical protein
MPFEVLLTQVQNMPNRYLLDDSQGTEQAKARIKFDKEMVAIKVPTILLERLKKEFDDSNA